jgi:hypothetical protein
MGVLPALNTFSLPVRDGSHLGERRRRLTAYDVLALSAFCVFFCPLPRCVQHLDASSRSLAARSVRVAWELLRQDERHRLLAYIEKAKAWEAMIPPLDMACCKTDKHRKAESSGRVRTVS